MERDSFPSSPGSEDVGGRLVRAGEIVMTRSPWVATVRWKKRSEVCAFCWKRKTGLKACPRCQFCHYCDEACQTKDWSKEHRYECKMLKEAVESVQERPDFDVFGDCENAFASQLLFMKALTRFTVDYPKFHPDINQETARTYFTSSTLSFRWDSLMSAHTHLVESSAQQLLHFREFVFERRKQCFLPLLPDESCLTLAKNILVASELIFEGIRTVPDSALGIGVYLDMHKLPVTCRGNCDWFNSGSRIVMKAVVDIPSFSGCNQGCHGSLPCTTLTSGTGAMLTNQFCTDTAPVGSIKITVSPALYRAGMLSRDERRKYQRIASKLHGAEYVECTCELCSDVKEAEASPVKCVTPSCMEPIPSDERAQLPCSQCGALNGSRLSLALAQLSEFTAKDFQINHHAEPAQTQSDEVCEWKARALLLHEMEEPRVVLHPHNLIRLSLLKRTNLLSIVLKRDCPSCHERDDQRLKYCEDVLSALSVYRNYFGETNHWYGEMLELCGLFGADYHLRHSVKGSREEVQQARQKVEYFQELLQQGRKIQEDFVAC